MSAVPPSTRERSVPGVSVLALGLASLVWPWMAAAQEVAPARTGLLAPFFWTESDRYVAPPTTAAPPVTTSGLFQQFRATNPPRAQQPTQLAASPRHRLLAPFYWQNPPATGTTFEQPPTFQQLPATWTPPYEGQQVQFDGQPNSPSDLPPAPDDPFFRLMQGEQIRTLPNPNAVSTDTVSPLVEELSPPPPNATGAGNGDAKTLAESESLGEEPEDNTLQFLRADTVLLEPGEMQFDVGVTYQLIEDNFTVVDTTTSNLVEAEIKQRLLVVPFEVRYGLTPRAQLFIGAPVGWSHTDFTTPTFQVDDSDAGIGDTTVGLSFVIFDNPDRVSDFVFTIAATLPTGDDPFIGAALNPTAPSLGDGFYAISTDLLHITAYDPVVIFYGIGFRHSFETDLNGIDVRPGNEYRANLGIGFAVNQDITLSARFNASFVERTELNGVTIPGSALEPFSIRFAATIAKECKLVEPFVDIGTTDDAAATRFGVTWTY